jgi:hypothetical protein
MKLSSREVEIFSQIEKNKKRRRLNAWMNILAIPVYVGMVRFFEFGESLPFMLGGALVGLSLANLSHVYFGVRSEDKLIGLLQRYVNRDPDAIQQFSDAAKSGGVAA